MGPCGWNTPASPRPYGSHHGTRGFLVKRSAFTAFFRAPNFLDLACRESAVVTDTALSALGRGLAHDSEGRKSLDGVYDVLSRVDAVLGAG